MCDLTHPLSACEYVSATCVGRPRCELEVFKRGLLSNCTRVIKLSCYKHPKTKALEDNYSSLDGHAIFISCTLYMGYFAVYG
jgi:hypothetical protein